MRIVFEGSEKGISLLETCYENFLIPVHSKAEES